MKRREFLTLLGGAAAAWPLAARGQQTASIRRVGASMDTEENNPDGKARFTAFRQTLHQLGWTEGQNIRIGLLFKTHNQRF